METTKTHIGVVNKKKLKNLKYHIRRTVLALLLAGAIKGVMGATDTKTSGNFELPPDYTTITLDISVDHGTTVSGLAKMYYDESVYPNFKEYCENIKELNNLEYNYVTPYQSIKIPVIVNKDNVFLNNIYTLETELNDMPLWVDYTIESGDTISSLAYLGAVDSTEAMDNINRICDYNNIANKSIINVGDKIAIINPKIGETKRKIYSLKESLSESLKLNDENEKKGIL